MGQKLTWAAALGPWAWALQAGVATQSWRRLVTYTGQSCALIKVESCAQAFSKSLLGGQCQESVMANLHLPLAVQVPLEYLSACFSITHVVCTSDASAQS